MAYKNSGSAIEGPPGAVPFLYALLTSLLIAIAVQIALPNSKTNGEDFIQDYLSARAALGGGDPYGDLVAMRAENGFPPTLPDPVHSNPHPPLAILLAAPVAKFYYPTALMAWRLLNVAAFGFAWTWTLRTFGRATWKTALLGGFIGFWAPVWQGLDFGQPSGILCLLTAAIWSAARRDRKDLGGALVGASCAVRPFFFILSAPGTNGSPRRIAYAALWAVAGGLLPFLVTGKSPFGWWRENASESAQYARICGTLGTVLGFGSGGGIALYLLSWLGLVLLARRGCDRDALAAFAIALLLLTYPVAWYHYDAIAVPAVVWLLIRSHAGERRISLWCAVLYIACRAFPSTEQSFELMMYFQFAGRALLVLGTALMLEAGDAHPTKVL